MPMQIQGNGGVVAEVDGSIFRAVRTTSRPIDYGALGHYQLAMNSGTIAAALAGSAVLFAFRWTDTTRFAVVNYISLSFQALTLFTANTLTDFGFDAYLARGSWTAAYTGGTAATLTGNNCKTRTAMGTTLLNQAMIISTTALATGNPTLDANAFANSIGDSQRVNPAAATEEQRVNDPTLIWQPNAANGEHPIVLVGNGSNAEGFVLRNRTVWPAAGTGIVTVQVRWAEVAAY